MIAHYVRLHTTIIKLVLRRMHACVHTKTKEQSAEWFVGSVPFSDSPFRPIMDNNGRWWCRSSLLSMVPWIWSINRPDKSHVNVQFRLNFSGILALVDSSKHLRSYICMKDDLQLGKLKENCLLLKLNC